MRWTTLSGALIVSLAGTGTANASSYTCSGVDSPWWLTLLIPFIAGGVVWLVSRLWNWWFMPPEGIAFAKDDPEKVAAVHEAQRTLPRFWEAFNNPAPDESEFALKVRLGSQDDAEFIWADEIKVESGRIYGRLANVPFEEGYEIGQIHEIDPEHIVDWCYFKSGVAQGHYMTRVMSKHMPRRFARRVERALGWAEPGWIQSVLAAAAPMLRLRMPLPQSPQRPEVSA